MPREVQYSTRFVVPDMLQRGKEQVIELPVYRGRSVVAPSAGTVTLRDESGDALVDAQVVAVTESVANYTVPAATLPATLSLSDQWMEQWVLTLGGQEYTFLRDASLVLRRLYPVVTEADLLRVHSELREWMAADQTDLQEYLDAAWDRIQLRLLESGRRPNLILSPGSLYGVHLDLTLALVFRDYAASTSADGKYMKLSEQYQASYDRGWDKIRWTYDFDEDMSPDESEMEQAGVPVLMTNVPGAWRYER